VLGVARSAVLAMAGFATAVVLGVDAMLTKG
jgi:hypothetical protein